MRILSSLSLRLLYSSRLGHLTLSYFSLLSTRSKFRFIFVSIFFLYICVTFHLKVFTSKFLLDLSLCNLTRETHVRQLSRPRVTNKRMKKKNQPSPTKVTYTRVKHYAISEEIVFTKTRKTSRILTELIDPKDRPGSKLHTE